MNAHSVGDNQGGIALFKGRSGRGQSRAGFAQGDDIIGIRFRGLGGFGTRDFAPIQAFVFKENHRVGVQKGRFHQAFGIRRIGRVHHFDAPDVENGGFDATRMVGTAPAVGPAGYPNQGLNRELPPR